MGRRSDVNGLGEPLRFDPDFNGPLKNRSCTDVIFLGIFMVFVAVWAGIGAYAICYGDPTMLLVPKDSVSRRCGKDYEVRDKPYLFFFDLTKCLQPQVPFTGCPTHQICVDRCPSSNAFSREDMDKDRYCDNGDCPHWYLESTSVQKRCIPILGRINQTILNLINVTDIDKLSHAINNIKLFAEAEEIGQKVVDDIMNIWWKLVIGIALALVACIIYIMMLRWVAAPMVWLSIFGALGCLAGGIYFTCIKYIEFRNQYPPKYEEEGRSIKTKRDLWLTGLIILSIFTIIILLMLIFLRKRIVLAIALIKEGSKAVSSVTASLFFPIFPWVMQVCVIAYAVAVALFLGSTGSPLYKTRNVTSACTSATGIVDDTVCVPEEFAQKTQGMNICQGAICKYIKMENDVLYPYLQAFNVVGFFWLIFFVSALAQMILAGVFAQWYWTWDKRSLPFFAVTAAIGRTLRYHIGTLAFGSLIVTICRLIRLCLEYLDHKLKKYDNELTRVILCCCKCFFECLERFIKFINKNAYIMCAIHGKNFCASARDAFSLLMRNILRVFVLDKVTDFLFFLSKILLTFGVGAISYVIFVTDLVSPFIDNSSLNYGAVPVTIIMIFTFLISSVFFSVYSMAVDTLFLCFLEDCERNDGSSQKPYYMSKNLMRIFGKNNKRD